MSNLKFTEQEFDIMVKELTEGETASFAMLCHIADKTLKPSVEKWCRYNSSLRGRECEMDIMQDIHIKLILNTVDKFLFKEDVTKVNRDPLGFQRWMFTLASRTYIDYAKANSVGDKRSFQLDEAIGIEMTDDVDSKEYAVEELKVAFETIMEANTKVYKVLTWVAQFVFYIVYSDLRKGPTNDIVSVFSDKTLFEMYDMLMLLAEQIDWLELKDEHKAAIMQELKKPTKSGVAYGDVRYREFYMLYKGEKSGVKSVSDWNNRLNNKAREALEQFDYKNNKEGEMEDDSSDS